MIIPKALTAGTSNSGIADNMDNLNNMTIGVVKTEQLCSKHVLLVCVGRRAASSCMDLISSDIGESEDGDGCRVTGQIAQGIRISSR